MHGSAVREDVGHHFDDLTLTMEYVRVRRRPERRHAQLDSRSGVCPPDEKGARTSYRALC